MHFIFSNTAFFILPYYKHFKLLNKYIFLYMQVEAKISFQKKGRG